MRTSYSLLGVLAAALASFSTPFAQEKAAEKSLDIAVPAPPSPPFAPEDVTASIVLPELNLKKILEEDAKSAEGSEKGMPRIGVFQDLPRPLHLQEGVSTQGVWLPRGKTAAVLALRILAPNALGVRLELTGLTLPDGAEIWVYNEDQPREAYGPFSRLPDGDVSLWTPSCYGRSVILACHLPDIQFQESASFHVTRSAVIYKSILTAIREKAGACNLDVSCYPAWADAALGVGGLGVIGSTGVVFCTCSLLADTQACTEVPYVLTAHHCVGGQTGYHGAETLEFYWRYQTPSCNGTPPDPASVPRTTGGAEYLAGMSGSGESGGGNDFTFLRMRNMPPQGLTYLGWTRTVPPLGTPVAAIHHPRGGYARISFGNLSNTNNPNGQYFHETLWRDGVTEPGSSGGCLMLEATQQIIGQLWGGDSSCTTPTLPDYYGRFDVTYPQIAAWLNPGPATVGFSAAQFSVHEDNGPATVTVVLSAPSRGDVSVQYETLPGTAVANKDFTPASGTLFFARGATQTTFQVPVFSNAKIDPPKTVQLVLTHPNCPVLGLGAALLQILDDDVDSDLDGLSDDEETQGVHGYATDPHNADTDGDWLTDGEELLAVHGVQTNPLLRDSDYDGQDDYTEIHYGHNPMDPNDTPRLSSLTLPLFK